MEEVFFAAGSSIGEVELDVLSFEVSALGTVIFALEAGDIGGELAQELRLGVEVEVFGGEGADGGGGVTQGEPAANSPVRVTVSKFMDSIFAYFGEGTKCSIGSIGCIGYFCSLGA